jgi:hypothetical protein
MSKKAKDGCEGSPVKVAKGKVYARQGGWAWREVWSDKADVTSLLH